MLASISNDKSNGLIGSATITLSINKLQNLIYFRDWATEYNNLIILIVPFTGSLNTKLNYSKYEYIVDSKTVKYTLSNLNSEALQIIYPQLLSSDIDFSILAKNYELDLYDNLIKKDVMQAIRDR